jgi:hypothetical protein
MSTAHETQARPPQLPRADVDPGRHDRVPAWIPPADIDPVRRSPAARETQTLTRRSPMGPIPTRHSGWGTTEQGIVPGVATVLLGEVAVALPVAMLGLSPALCAGPVLVGALVGAVCHRANKHDDIQAARVTIADDIQKADAVLDSVRDAYGAYVCGEVARGGYADLDDPDDPGTAAFLAAYGAALDASGAASTHPDRASAAKLTAAAGRLAAAWSSAWDGAVAPGRAPRRTGRATRATT